MSLHGFQSLQRLFHFFWLLPKRGWIKVNGASDGNPGLAVGVEFFTILEVLLRFFVIPLGQAYAYEAEFFDAMNAIEIVENFDWNPLWLESNSTYTVNLFDNDSVDVPWKFKARWETCLSYIASILSKVFHIFREGNKVADTLSKYAVNSPYEVW